LEVIEACLQYIAGKDHTDGELSEELTGFFLRDEPRRALWALDLLKVDAQDPIRRDRAPTVWANRV
jgi:ferritin-like protein